MITVVIPTFNRENTIKRCIKSVLNQTYNDIEVIVVDDNSTDNTFKIISQMADNRIRYHRNKKNVGACASRNLGISMAKGDYIAFQDSDDEWLPEKLKKQISYLLNQNCDLVFCSLFRISVENKEIYPPYTPCNNSKLYEQLLFENCVGTVTLLGKRVVFENIKFDERMPRFQDWELMLRISRVYDVKYLNETLVNSYIQKDSISVNPELAITGLKIIYDIHKESIRIDNTINAEFCRKIADYMLFNAENPKYYYKKSCELRFAFKNFVFYLMCVLNLQKLLLVFRSTYSKIRKTKNVLDAVDVNVSDTPIQKF